MQTYLVGGAVRDQLLGISTQDRDWVVVGANAEQMLTQGFTPVGKDFPVFLHPQTHEEYALARTERKTAKGYAGFSFHAASDVTLEQDLMRRDLTINAMAQDANGNIIDPFGGQHDLANGILRHVSPAFTEDPVRILRTARFAARYGFQVAPETMQLMREITQNGETAALVAERVWQELAKGLMEKQPSRMIEILRECDALAVILPELNALFGVKEPLQYHPEGDSGKHTLLVLQRAADLNLSLPERYAALLHDLGKGLTPIEKQPKHYGHDIAGVPLARAISQRLKVPKPCAELAELACRWHLIIHDVCRLKDSTVLKVLQQTDAFRRPERFFQLLNVCQADSQGRLHAEIPLYPPNQIWQHLLKAAQNINTREIASQFAQQPDKIAEAIARARLSQIQQTPRI